MESTNTPSIDHADLLGRLPEPALREAIRLRVGLSAEKLSRHVGVAGMTIRNWERGTTPSNPHLLRRYVEALERLEAIAAARRDEVAP